MSRVIAVLLAAAAVSSVAHAVPRYRLTDLGALPGSAYSAPRSISETGLIVGESGQGPGENTLVRFESGLPVVLTTLAGASTASSRGINNRGVAAVVVQGRPNGGEDDRAALATLGGATQLFGLRGYSAAGAFDVNDSGTAVGYSLASGSIGSFAEGGAPVGQRS